MSARLTELRGSLAHEEWRAARASLKQARRRLDQALNRCEAATQADAAFGHRSELARARLEEARGTRDAAARRLEAARLEVERGEGGQRRFADRLRSAIAQRGLAVADLGTIVPEVDAATSALAAVEAGAEDQSWSVLEEESARLRGIAVEAAAEAAIAEQHLGEATAAFAEAEGERGSASADVHAAAARAELALSAVGALTLEAEAAATRIVDLTAALAAQVAEAEAASARSHATAADVALARTAVDTAWEAVNAADRAVASAAAEARLALATLASARGRLSGTTGEGGVVRAVASRTLDARRLVDCLHVTDHSMADAVAAALEADLGAWVVDDIKVAAAHLDTDGPRERLLSAHLDPIVEVAPPAPYLLLSSAIEVAPEARGAISRLLAGVWLASDVDAAQRALTMGAVAAALRDGTVVTTSGLRGGRRVETLELAEAEHFAATESERIARLEAAAVTDAANAREQLSDLDQALSVAVETDRAARAAEAGAAAIVTGAQQALDAALAQEERAGRLLGSRQAESGAAADAQGATERRLASVDAQRATVETGLRSAQAHSTEARTAADLTKAAADEADLVVSRAKAEGAHIEERREAARRALDAARSRLTAAETRRVVAEGDSLTAIVYAMRGRVGTARAVVELSSAQEWRDAAAAPIAELERAVLGLEAEHAEVAVAVARATDERDAAEREVVECEAAVAELAGAVRDQADDDSAELDPAAAERAEREIVRLERRISALGPVNAFAPEQHEALEARVTTFGGHHEDLVRSGSDLRAMARALEREIEQRFDTVFGAVSFHFQELYAELFPGGKATLRLEEAAPATLDPDGIESAAEHRRPGVEILAQPAGKRLTPLRLLSGGERALTALAVVLALQQVNPSPFYVFDEVDASLDDSNVLRFTRLLRRLGTEQQFLVVTHNHITMAAADALWGVTIDGDGVSSVIGVRFDEAELTGAPTASLHRVAG
jgi:chromosome segregation protein